MATTVTKNLKLRVDSNLTANAKFNLERIDDLGSTFLIDNQETVNIRSKVDLVFRPEDPSVGGSGTGGNVTFGQPSQPLDNLFIYSNNTLIENLALEDVAVGGNKSLQLKYKSDINTPVDTASNRTLNIDVDGADRNLVLGGDFTFTGGSLVLALSGATSLSLPLSGTVATLAGTETLTNKVIDASLNTLLNISNSSISNSAAISYSKLNLTGSIVNADISNGAGIVYSKLLLTGQVVNADISNTAAISYSKLSLSNSIVDSDVSSVASISYSKLNLSGSIKNSDVSPTAAIDGSKIHPDFGSQDIQTSGAIRFNNSHHFTLLLGPLTQSNNLQIILPDNPGAGGYVLATDGVGNTNWVPQSGGGGGGLPSASFLWISGTTFTANHNFGSRHVLVQILDTTNNYQTIEVDQVIRPDGNNVQCASSESANNWLVLLQQIA